MGKTSVAIIKGTHPSEMTEKALGLITAEKLIESDDAVLIKPNYVRAAHPSTGITTDSRVVESIITVIRRLGVEDIVVGEGGAGDTESAFDVVGMRALTQKLNVKLVNLNRDSRIQVRIPQALALPQIGVSKTALKSTCIINVPTLKVHHKALVTLSLKNLMGLIIPKSIMHSQINEKIVDLASLFGEKVKINVIDGLIGSEVDEVHGNPIKMNILIAGRDMVAVDTVATAVMGIEPTKVKYLKLAEDRGLGVSNLDDINVLGENIKDVVRKFKLPPTFAS